MKPQQQRFLDQPRAVWAVAFAWIGAAAVMVAVAILAYGRPLPARRDPPGALSAGR